MPLPLIPLIAAGANLLGQGVNAITQGAANRSQQRYNTQMYERQRNDALADYAMQNQYNSPAATMERLKAAGLNPNLAYGSGATTTAAPVRTSDAKSYNPTAPQVDMRGLTSSFMDTYDVQLKQVQTDNIKTTIETQKHQQQLLDAQTLATLTNVPKSEAETAAIRQRINQQNQSFPISLEGEQLKNKQIAASTDKTKADTTFTINQDVRNSLLTTQSLAKSAQEILRSKAEMTKIPMERDLMQQQLANLQNSNTLQDLEIELKKRGLTWSDPVSMRILKSITDDPASAQSKANQILKEVSRLSGRDAFWKWINDNKWIISGQNPNNK